MKLMHPISFLLFLSLNLSAKEISKPIVAPVAQSIQATTIHGDTVAQFLVQNADGKYSISMSTNAGVSRQKNLTQTDFNYILKNYLDLPEAMQIPTDCYRARMDIILKKNDGQISKKSSCFGLNTMTEPKYVYFSKVLINAL